tara:strand:+ start:535 stop:993 length:459 start_codon:yes stop_codon:yes gene_type:complete
MFEMILSVLTGGATGILGSLIGKAFGFLDFFIEEKKKDNDHARTIEMTRLSAELRSEELENERAIVEEEQAGKQRAASYRHDMSAGVSYPWVAAILRLVRPTLTLMLIAIVWYIYATSNDIAQQETIIQSVIYMTSTAVLWWFGDRAMKGKK